MFEIFSFPETTSCYINILDGASDYGMGFFMIFTKLDLAMIWFELDHSSCQIGDWYNIIFRRGTWYFSNYSFAKSVVFWVATHKPHLHLIDVHNTCYLNIWRISKNSKNIHATLFAPPQQWGGVLNVQSKWHSFQVSKDVWCTSIIRRRILCQKFFKEKKN